VVWRVVTNISEQASAVIIRAEDMKLVRSKVSKISVTTYHTKRHNTPEERSPNSESVTLQQTNVKF